MTYQQTIDYLYASAPMFQNLGAGAYKEGLDNTHFLDDFFHHPHRQFKTIHVAGTNGKGSCCHTLAAILQSAGYRVGLYTSPHLVDFRERIRIDGDIISKNYVISWVEKIKQFEDRHFSFFELTTAMAFKYFADKKVDIAIIETGLGGRLDCTNIIFPILSVITNISFDHTQFLGDTLEKIATEKAGIIKDNTPVVIGETVQETRPIFLSTAKRLNAPIIFAEEETIPFKITNNQLSGACQKKNEQTILAATTILKQQGILSENIYQDTVLNGFANVCNLTGLQGRWQTINKSPLTICDTGHNIGGWEYLAPQIASVPCKNIHIIFGCVNDKDITGILSILQKHFGNNICGDKKVFFYFTQATVKRSRKAEEVQALAKEFSLNGKAYPSVAKAYISALRVASEEDFIFIGGSTFVVADLLNFSI